MKTTPFIGLLVLTIVLMVSCATPNVAYLEDIPANVPEQVVKAVDIQIRPGDKISIIVNSKDPLLTNLFNLPYVSKQIGSATAGSGSSQGVSGYTVNEQGCIDFPVLGEVSVAGKNREEIARFIKSELMAQNLVKDPVVTVDFMNLTFSVLGEVGTPGRYQIDKDRISLLEAISMAGDLTIFGKRQNVFVQRIMPDGKLVLYRVNLNSGYDLYSSPVYYLQQGDVVYVEPNSVRARQATVNANNVRSASFWMSLASLLTTITTVFILK